MKPEETTKKKKKKKKIKRDDKKKRPLILKLILHFQANELDRHALSSCCLLSSIGRLGKSVRVKFQFSSPCPGP